MNFVDDIETILASYKQSFSGKEYTSENDDHDLLMDLFDISPEIKRENRQYWGRELGMCWQQIVSRVFHLTRPDYGPALRFGTDEPCDFIFSKTAVDTKYRIGSGDSGTLKKFKQYGSLLREKEYEPVFLILRDDNLQAAITAARSGGWVILTGEEKFDFILKHTMFDLRSFLAERVHNFRISR